MSGYDAAANDAVITVKTTKNDNDTADGKTDKDDGKTDKDDGKTDKDDGKTDTDGENNDGKADGGNNGNDAGSKDDTDGSNTNDGTGDDKNDGTDKDDNNGSTNGDDSSKKPSARFSDVTEGSWYESAVSYVLEKGLFSGTSESTFSPNGTMTRSMLVTVLWRMEGTPDVTADSAFSDVENGSWYTDAVAWAASKGIVNGYGDGRFGPNDEVTREQMAVIMYNFTKAMGYDVTGNASLDKFSDNASVDSWAADAMKWAVGAGIMNGNADGTLNPRGTATRAQVATIMMNYVKVLLDVK